MFANETMDLLLFFQIRRVFFFFFTARLKPKIHLKILGEGKVFRKEGSSLLSQPATILQRDRSQDCHHNLCMVFSIG